MNLQQVRVFAAVAEHLSFTRAAEMLFLSQSGVSQHIDRLEREQQVRLFDRLGRRVRLTDAGAALVPYARRLLNLEHEAIEVLNMAKGLGAGHLRIGASPTPGTYLLPRLLGCFHQRFPSVGISLTVDATARIAEQVLAGSLGAALVEGAVADARLTSQPSYADELFVITPPKLTPGDGTAFTREEVEGLRLIAREPSSLTRRLIETRFAQAGLVYRPAMELSHVEATKKAVQAGLGAAILSGFTVADEVASGHLRAWRIAELPLRRFFTLLTHRDSAGSPVTEAFLTLMAEAPEQHHTFF